MSKLSRRTMLMLPALVAAPHVRRAQAMVDEHAVADMLVLGFLGASRAAPGAQRLATHLEAGLIGGVCFLGHNTRSRDGIEGLTRLFRAAGADRKPLICVDQEGGAVQRLGKRSGYAAFPPARAVAARHEPTAAAALYADMARLLTAAGFNLNLAPVVDLRAQPQNPVVARWGRAYGKDGVTVAHYAGAFVAGHREVGVLTALKHFPGHGSTLVDSHSAPVDLTPTWHADELTPFRHLSERGLIDIVMSGHLSHARLTAGLPATVSPHAVKLLREEIGYRGVVMTDDLDMKAIRSRYTLTDAVVRAIAAGYDLILLSNSLRPDRDLPQRVIAAVKDAVADGRISTAAIDATAQRLAILKSGLAS